MKLVNARTYFHKRYSEVAMRFNKLYGEILTRLYELPFPARITGISGFNLLHPQICLTSSFHNFNLEVSKHIHHLDLPIEAFAFAGAGFPIDRIGTGTDENAVRLGSVEKRAEQND